MSDRKSCLNVIGEIAVQWSQAEEDLRDILWLYVGTDRPTFDILFDGRRAADIEELVKKLVSKKEPNEAARFDIVEAVARAGLHRRNRNTILHKMRSDDVDDAGRIFPKLNKALEETKQFCAALRRLRVTLTRFVTVRDALDTPVGDEARRDAETRLPEYQAVSWPEKSQVLTLR